MIKVKNVYVHTCYLCDTEKPERGVCPKCGSSLTRTTVKRYVKKDGRFTFQLDDRQHGGPL